MRINTSSSMPKGIYKAVTKTLHVGDIVEVCLPDPIAMLGVTRHYIRKGKCPNKTESVVKKVVALAQDKVELSMQAVKVNGEVLPHSATLLHDQHGHEIPHIARSYYKLSIKEVWLYGSNNAKSWDSRYYGPVNINTIQHIMSPVWVGS